MIIDDILILYIFMWKNRRKKQKKHSRYRKIFYNNLSVYEQWLRDRRLPRVALQDPSQSSWKTLLKSGNDQALITLTGLNFTTFYWLLERFRPIYDGHSPFIDPHGKIVPLCFPGRGRKRLMEAVDCLGLVLSWTRTRGSNMVLQMICVMTGTTVSMYLRFARRILVHILLREPDSAIKVPSEEVIRQYQLVIQESIQHFKVCGAPWMD